MVLLRTGGGSDYYLEDAREPFLIWRVKDDTGVSGCRFAVPPCYAAPHVVGGHRQVMSNYPGVGMGSCQRGQ
ncbi:hypothetical protein FIBSPDRAFT_851614 [Athelia psychrophila]|uniref:Uncharacterized protein n=1 Tax=Athelia psychrophila TaxID=1759441 RepID=A0A166SBD8_9AGAM|nr:hypothetical protein FIBSPDRAFT_851614 [Fibularhizoctonia sp. CBS 109695]